MKKSQYNHHVDELVVGLHIDTNRIKFLPPALLKISQFLTMNNLDQFFQDTRLSMKSIIPRDPD